VTKRYNRRMRVDRGLLALCLAAVVAAQEPAPPAQEPSVRSTLERVLAEIRSFEATRPAADHPGIAAWLAEAEALRQGGVDTLLGAIRFHGPGGEGKRLDTSLAEEALLKPPLAPDSDAAFLDTLEALLRIDPASAYAWLHMEALLHRLRSSARADWHGVQRWLAELRGSRGLMGEAALAVELLFAECCYETGDRQRARETCALLLSAEGGSDELREHARRLRTQCSVRAAGLEAPAFRIRRHGGGADIRSDDYRGRCLLLHFWHEEEVRAVFLTVLSDCHARIGRGQLALLTIPIFDGTSPSNDFADRLAALDWEIAEPNAVGVDVAKAYGVEGSSALFLISPDGRILKSQDWGGAGGTEEIRELCTRSAGPPLDERLGGVTTWASCRELWHDLAGRRVTRFPDPTWERARQIGLPAHAALLLAAATGEGSTPRPVDGATLHGRLLAAWMQRKLAGDGGPWERALAPLSKPSTDESLAVVDALFDLGLSEPALRGRLEEVAAHATPWETVSMALRTLQFDDCESAPAGLRKLQKHKMWQVRLALAEGLRAYRHKEAVDLLIALLGDKRLRVRAKARDHLELLTGERIGLSQKEWAKWRAAEGSTLRLRPREISAYKPFQASGHRYAQKDYFGLDIASDRLVFVLDKSESMYYGLFDGVIEEVRAHLEGAGPTTKFAVIEFDEKATAWKEEFAPANASTIDEATRFLQRAMPYGPTNIIDGLRRAIAMEEVDALVLLSDGLPNRGTPNTPAAILAEIGRINRYARVAIHTVQLLEGRSFPHDGPRGKERPPLDSGEKLRREQMRVYAPTTELGAFLKNLALDNDGHYGIGFADAYRPPPGAKFRPGTDK